MKKTHTNFFIQKKPWSIFKDGILQQYLPPYFQKILSTNKPVFYIDGFAGKGIFDDGNPGSPIIALNAIDEALKRTKASDPNITCYFIEKMFITDLTRNLGDRPNVKIINGRFQDNIDSILSKIGNDNVFLYIDPFGVCDLDMNRFNDLVESDYYSIEFLLNFQSHGFFRLACSAMNVRYEEGDTDDVDDYEEIKYFPSDKKVSNLDRIAGGNSWKQIVLDYKNGQINGKEAEKRISSQYCETLRSSFDYVLEMPISDNPTNIPKYRMIFATKKLAGYYLMIEIMFRQIERIKTSHSKGQLTFLNETIDNVPFDPNEEKQLLLSMISKNKRESITEIFVKYYRTRGLRCSPSDLRKFVKDFESDEMVLVDRDPKYGKSGKPSSFLTENSIQTVNIVRN